MRFLVDASLPRSAVPMLRQLSHDAVDVRDIGMRSATDDVIAAHARSFARRQDWLDQLTGRLAIVEPWRVRFRPV